jgi:type III secretion system low calcium response chaperone LcrH/SycD
MQADKEHIRQAADGVGAALQDKGMAKMETLTEQLMQKGGAPKDLLGISDEMVEGVYGQAYRLYNTGKYRDACQIFRMLVMINATEPRYIMGQAACLHMLKEFKSAAESYTICGMMDPDNPVPHFHASDCYIQMQNPVSALVALQMAVKRAGERPQYKTLKDRAEMTMASLRKEINRLRENEA